MRAYELPDGLYVDLDSVLSVGSLFVNKNYDEYSCYEVQLSGNTSVSVFEQVLPRSDFITIWTTPT